MLCMGLKEKTNIALTYFEVGNKQMENIQEF